LREGDYERGKRGEWEITRVGERESGRKGEFKNSMIWKFED
jgi:hypothetical protein